MTIKGEMPKANEKKIFNLMAVILINLGVRHNANKAAMNAAVGKTDLLSIIPAVSCVLSGSHLSSGSVGDCMKFISKNKNKEVSSCFDEKIKEMVFSDSKENYIAPGFGSLNGSEDILTFQYANKIFEDNKNIDCLKWSIDFSKLCHEKSMGITIVSLYSCLALEAGFNAKQAAMLFQYFGISSTLATSIEHTSITLSDFPFMSDDNYNILGEQGE